MSMHSRATIPPPSTLVREPRPGDVLGGRYHIEAELGRGGFGVVYRARHGEIERQVAIKVLLATYARADPTAVARFRREAQIASSLHYPNVVQLFDYGETEEGVFYIVMEFLTGKSLADHLAREGRFPPSRAVHIIRQVLFALTEAHARGIVHRDIKPDNVMLTPLAFDPDFVKVMDFGIAKMVSNEGMSLTQAGLTLGTPRYMPEEQLRGRQLTPATDLYSVGVVLYELLTGRHAVEAGSLVEVASRILEGAEIRIPMGTHVPDALARIVNKACHRDPADRYQRASDFLADLEAWMPSVPTEHMTDGDDTVPEGMKTQLLLAQGAAEAAAQTQILAEQAKTIMLSSQQVNDALAEKRKEFSAEATSVVRAPSTTEQVGAAGARTPTQVLNLLRLAIGLSGAGLTLLIVLVLRSFGVF